MNLFWLGFLYIACFHAMCKLFQAGRKLWRQRKANPERMMDSETALEAIALTAAFAIGFKALQLGVIFALVLSGELQLV